MSMQHYALCDYGLYLDYETLKYMASKIFDDYTDEAFDDDDWRFLDALYGQGYVEYSSEFTGEAVHIRDDGVPMWDESHETYSYDTCWYAPAYREMQIFGAAYKDVNELIEEFKDRLGEYLPEDYDYRENLAWICGTYFG